MRNFIFGFVSVLILAAIVFFGFLLIRSFGSSGPVSPEQLNPGVKDFGNLRIEVFGKGQPVVGVEVDLGKVGSKEPQGPMSAMKTDQNGVALFEKVPVGIYDIFWNGYAFPQDYNQPPKISVNISKDQTLNKRINLAPKQ